MGFLAGFARGIGPSIERAGTMGAQNITQNARRREDRANKLEDQLAAARQKAAELGIQVAPDASLEEIQQQTGVFQDPAAQGARKREQDALDKGYLPGVDKNTGLPVSAARLMAEDQERVRGVARETSELGLTAAKQEVEQGDPAYIKQQKQEESQREQNKLAMGLGIRNIYNPDGSQNAVQMQKYMDLNAQLQEAALELSEAKAAYYKTPRTSAVKDKFEQNQSMVGKFLPKYLAEIAHYEEDDYGSLQILNQTIEQWKISGNPALIKDINERLMDIRATQSEGYSGYLSAVAGSKKGPPKQAPPKQAPQGEASIDPSFTSGETPTTAPPALGAEEARWSEEFAALPSSGGVPSAGEAEIERQAAELGLGGGATTAEGSIITPTVPDTAAVATDSTTVTPTTVPDYHPEELPPDPRAEALQREAAKVMGQQQRDLDTKKESPEELQLRYADTDLSIQERYYNPGSLMLGAVEEGHNFGWKGLVGVDTSGYAQFDSPKAGMDALKQQLRVDRGRTKKDGSPLTVGDFVKKYVGEDADPDGTKRALKNYPQLLGKNAPNGLDTHIKDIEFQALLKAVMTNENHTADSLSVFESYIDDPSLGSEELRPGENPIIGGTGDLGATTPAGTADVTTMNYAALREYMDTDEFTWEALSQEEKDWVQRNHPKLYGAMVGN